MTVQTRTRPGLFRSTGMVQNLVNQFDNPLAFYRELIQNSLDAKSNRIDVTLEFHPNETGGGKLVIAVEDDGEGMDEHIIDNYLLVLFRSTKEDDFTKIGKFGIGFMSIFAIKPKLARVFTAKNGEIWRIDFHGHQSYKKYRLAELREGTRVELIRPYPAAKYPALVKKSFETVRYWCKYAEAGIFVRDLNSPDPPPSPVSEPFDLPGGAALRYVEEGTEIVMGFSSESQPFYGFYNRGLTLKEGHKPFFPGVTFRAKSRYLEHTLTRDNVMEDENYQKLMNILDRLVRQEMAPKLKTELMELAAASRTTAGNLPGEASDRWKRAAAFLSWHAQNTRSWFRGSTIDDWPILPTLGGRPVSLRDLGKAPRPIYYDDIPNRITEWLTRRRCPVVASGPWVEWLAGVLATEPVQASKVWILPVILPKDRLDAPARSFCATLSAMDAGQGRKYVRILPASFDYPGSCIRDFIFVTQKENEIGSPAPAAREPDTFFDHLASSLFAGERRSALVNLSHPFIRRLIQLHETRPGLAGYLCLKVMHLHDGRVPPDKKRAFCNLAEKFEAVLLEDAVKRDVRAGSAHA